MFSPLCPKIKMYLWTGANLNFFSHVRNASVLWWCDPSDFAWMQISRSGNSNPSAMFSNPALSSKTDFSVYVSRLGNGLFVIFVQLQIFRKIIKYTRVHNPNIFNAFPFSSRQKMP